MKIFISIFLTITTCSYAGFNENKLQEDLSTILDDLRSHYIYLGDKNIDLSCIKNKYSAKFKTIKTDEQRVLFFEYVLDEFYDNHIHLNTNYPSSYRLYSPIYATIDANKIIISNVWKTQIENISDDILTAEVLEINSQPIQQAVDAFPTMCQDKSNLVIRQWLVNKILAGRYSEPRILTLKLKNETVIKFDLDTLKKRKDIGVLSSKIKHNIGIIRVNNSLGSRKLARKFKKALKKFTNTDGLIIDLRNTVDGGDSIVAKPIMANFVSDKQPYQKHVSKSKSWTEYVEPKGKKHYTKPVVILVGRWTGSMGEGLAIGFEGINRGVVVGTLMERLAGAMNGFNFKHANFGYSLSTEKLFHVNGVAREKYIPTILVKQTSLDIDETLEQAFNILLETIKISEEKS